MRCEFLLHHMSESLCGVFNIFDVNVLDSVSEIRFRSGGYITLTIRNSTYFFDYNGDLYNKPSSHCVKIDKDDFDRLFLSLCDYSVHKHTDTLKRGYISLENGVRIGVCSKAAYDGDELVSVNEIGSLNVRIPREVRGFSRPVAKKIFATSTPSIIVAGMPNSGKTTFLKDLALTLADGEISPCKKVCIVDERNEFQTENELAQRADILSGFKKPLGIEIAVRTMSPEVIICDEIASMNELEKIKYGFSCGAAFALSVHIGNAEELFTKPIIKELIATGEFSYIVYLDEYKYKTELIDITEFRNEIFRSNNYPAFNNGNRDIYVT